ncbi:MAG: hypothetical protein HN623_05830, partial [Bdellovibrionales bacterium]|nr:hypothetical protein [Bdellovibrionales bacterium]
MKTYILLTFTLILVSSNLFAYPSELRSLTRSFPVIADSVIAQCTLCHLDDEYDLNQFGLDYDDSDS